MSDQKLVTILKVVTTLQLPPPSLANTTTYYDEIPVREGGREGVREGWREGEREGEREGVRE